MVGGAVTNQTWQPGVWGVLILPELGTEGTVAGGIVSRGCGEAVVPSGLAAVAPVEVVLGPVHRPCCGF